MSSARFPGQHTTELTYGNLGEIVESKTFYQSPVDLFLRSLEYHEQENVDPRSFIELNDNLRNRICTTIRNAPKPTNAALITTGGNEMPEVGFVVPHQELLKDVNLIPCLAIRLQQEKKSVNGKVILEVGYIETAYLDQLSTMVCSGSPRWKADLHSILKRVFEIDRISAPSKFEIQRTGEIEFFRVKNVVFDADGLQKRKLVMMMFEPYWRTGYTVEARNSLLVQYGVAKDESPGSGSIDGQRKGLALSISNTPL